MPHLTAADEQLIHQIPEPLPNVVTWHEHWRESYFFVMHHPDEPGDVVILTMATYPARQELDCFQMGRIDNQQIFALHARPYGDDPHTTVVGPVEIDIAEPYRKVHLRVDGTHTNVAVGLDLTFTARTAAHGLRRGTMKWRHETVWDQSHMIQSGRYDGTYTMAGTTYEVDGWWGQRDHSWGIRDHRRCPLWMWLAIQLPDGMLAVWNWEYADGARVYTDGCWAPADGSDPVPVVGFDHDLHWTDGDGREVSYGRDGADVRGLAGRVTFALEGGRRVVVDAEGTWCAPYGDLGGGQHQMVVRTDDGRTGTAIYEVTGAHHHRFFPEARGERLPPG
jgi:hypothetical protein